MGNTIYMKRALELAQKGVGNVSPNPLVGAVIVKNNGVIGEGYHKRFGDDHAEIIALNDAGDEADGADLYCTLEPCTHYGKTGPCADAVIKRGIKRVFIGIIDPNPFISGQGAQRMREAGIEVETGMLEAECSEINRQFITFITEKRPYVTMKIAQSLDGMIARKVGEQTAITGAEVQREVHRLRTEHDAVLIGSRTMVVDDPLLTPRLYKGKMPKRIILDTELNTFPDAKMFTTVDSGSVILATCSEDSAKKSQFQHMNVEVLEVDRNVENRIDLVDLITKLAQSGIATLFVEGGAEVFSSFLKAELVDKLILITAPDIYGSGVPGIITLNGKTLNMADVEYKQLGRDMIVSGKPELR